VLLQNFEKYFAQNDPSKGGSFYLQVSRLILPPHGVACPVSMFCSCFRHVRQSKIYRAKECIDKEIEVTKAKADKAKADFEKARKSSERNEGS
jgi:hypothetical protein